MARTNAPTMRINLIGRIGNIPLGVSHSLVPLFEAVVNSIQAIEALDRTEGQITYLAENSFDYTPTPDGLGYFNFNKKLKAYTTRTENAKRRAARFEVTGATINIGSPA